MTYVESIHHAVAAIIEANPSGEEARKAFWSLIPKEHHVTHHH